METKDTTQINAYLSDRYMEDGLPSHIVIFDALEQLLAAFLQASGYTKTETFFYAHFADGKRSQNVLLFTRKRWESRILIFCIEAIQQRRRKFKKALNYVWI